MHPVARRRTRFTSCRTRLTSCRTRFTLGCAPFRLLRLFPSAAPLRPLLRSLFSYSEGRRGAADGKRRSRRGSALLWSAERSAGTIGGAVRSADEAGSSGCAGWLAAHRACPVESLAGWSSGSVLAGAPELRHRPRARRGTRHAGGLMVCGAAPTPSASGRSADPIGFRFWRSGRIVPPRTPPHRRRNRGIMRKSPSASGVLARTILPERHIPPRAGSAGAVFSASSGRATPVEVPAAAMLRARTRSARPAAPAAAVRGVDGAGRPGGKRWPAHNFRVRRRRCASGERRHCATS